MNANIDSMLMRLLLLLLLAFPLVSNSNSEGDSLLKWKLALVDPANVLQSWDPTLVNPCTWFHITCNTDNAIIRVDLGNARLSGSLVPDLGNLTHLQYLEVFENQISGAIPRELGKLKELVSLDLYSNNLTGHIPKSFGKLKSLNFLRLNNNNLSGPIPRELTRLKKLQVLDLSSNDLCGTIPLYGGLANFTPISFQNNPRLNKTGPCS